MLSFKKELMRVLWLEFCCANLFFFSLCLPCLCFSFLCLSVCLSLFVTPDPPLFLPSPPPQDEHHRVNDVGMAYLLPLVSLVMSSEAIKDSTREDTMVFLGEHAHLGASALLPRTKVLTVLVDVMRHHPRIAHQAGLMMTEFVKQMQRVAQRVEVKAAETDILLDGYPSEHMLLRSSIVQSLAMLPFEMTDRAVVTVWVACHDVDEQVSGPAAQLWKEREFELPGAACSMLEDFLTSQHEPVRVAASDALKAALAQHTDQVPSVLDRLLESYVQLLVVPEPVRDKVGNIISEPFVDPWPSRAGLAQGFAALAPYLEEAQTLRIVKFFISTALGDRSAEAREAVVAAGQRIMMEKGSAYVAKLLPVFDSFLSAKSTTSAQDTVRRGVIVLLGSVATHLDPADPRIPTITDSLIATLSTPSQKVQEAVSACLQPLVSATKERGPELLELLMNQALTGATYGERRGAAYGVAAVVKACGLKIFKAYDGTQKIVNALGTKVLCAVVCVVCVLFVLLCVLCVLFVLCAVVCCCLCHLWTQSLSPPTHISSSPSNEPRSLLDWLPASSLCSCSSVQNASRSKRCERER